MSKCITVSSVIQPLTSDGTNVCLTWSAIPGGSYRLQFTTNLNGGKWFDLATNIIANDVVATNLDALNNTSARFLSYQIRSLIALLRLSEPRSADVSLPAALFVFFPAAAGTWIVAAHFGA